MWNPNSHPYARFTRRDVLGSAVAGASALACSALRAGQAGPAGQVERARKGEGKGVRGRIKQSIAFWCFNSAGEKWDLERTCQVAKELFCPSVELVPPKDWAVLKKHGLLCAMSPNGMPAPPFVRGWNNPQYHEELIARTTEAIDACAAAGFPNVIAFTGYKWRDAADPKSGEIGRDEGARNCTLGLKKIVGQAERTGVTICLEHLNTRDDSHPMKGHPGYQGDDLDWVAGIIRAVGSPRLRLLFDVYHVQVMHGDVIRRIEQQKDLIGHVHVAGNPGRGELDDRQEINYRPIMQKLLDIGYSGYVGQEFIPTREPLAGLREAVGLCDV
jgi:hydroxypyruvate isomerase